MKFLNLLILSALTLAVNSFADTPTVFDDKLSQEQAERILSNEGVQSEIKKYRINELEEGLHSGVSQDKIDSIREWAINSYHVLNDTRALRGDMTVSEEVAFLQNTIVNTVIASSPKRSETLMRWSLNRALKVLEILDEETNSGNPGVVDAKLRVLRKSVDFALDYYEDDIRYLSRSSNVSVRIDYANFGVQYYLFLSDLNKSVLDASAQYKISRFALIQLQGDLDRDSQQDRFAFDIVLIYQQLKNFTDDSSQSDQVLLKRVRAIKKLEERLTVLTTEKKSAKKVTNN